MLAVKVIGIVRMTTWNSDQNELGFAIIMMLHIGESIGVGGYHGIYQVWTVHLNATQEVATRICIFYLSFSRTNKWCGS